MNGSVVSSFGADHEPKNRQRKNPGADRTGNGRTKGAAGQQKTAGGFGG